MIHRADCPTSDSQRFRRNNQYSVITAGCLPSSDHEQVARDQRRRKVLRSDVRGSSCSLRHSHCSHTFRHSFRRRYRETGPHGCDGGPNRRCRHRYPTQRAGYDRRSINRGNHSRHYGMVCLRKRFPHRSHCCLHCSPVWPQRLGAGRELRSPSRTYFSPIRLRPDLRGLQENAVLAGEVRPRSGAARCAAGPSPDSRHDLVAAPRDRSARRI